MTHVAALVALIFTSSLLSCSAGGAAGAGGAASVSCTWTKVLPNAEVHVSFLRSDPGLTAPSLRLYHSVWSGERALLGCGWSDDAAVTRDYSSLCRERAPQEDEEEEFSQHPGGGFDLDSLSEERCVSLSSPGLTELQGRTRRRQVRSADDGGQGERSEVKINHRVKRGFIVPGTLWCGSGNKALSYEDLGAFSETDSCCREHDQCKHTILSFNSNYGVFNSNIFTMSHCDCDNKFHSCLKEANDSISSVVGYTFFNLLKMHCFKFSHQLQCMERNWFGMCKETKMALYAEVYPPTLFETAEPTESSVNTTGSDINSTTGSDIDSTTSSVINSTTSSVISSTTGSVTDSTTDSDINSTTGSDIDSTTSSVISSTTSSVISSTTSSVTDSTTTPAPLLESTASDPKLHTAPTPSPSTTSTSTTTITPSITTSTGSNTSPAASTRKNQTQQEEMQIMACGVYKDLDRCKDKILPQQKMYGLHNAEMRTLYHCNCTSRLFQTLSKQRRLTEVQALLLGHVSQSCFLPRDCTAGDISCTAVVVRAELPQLDPGAAVEEQRHLQAVQLTVRRPNTRRAKRKDRALRLHRLCVRMIRPRQTSRKRGQNAAGRERALV